MVVCASGLDDGTLQQTNGNQKWYDNYVDRANEMNLLMPEMGFEAGKPASRAFVAQLVFNSMTIDGEDKVSESDNTKSDEPDDFKVVDNIQNNVVASDGYAEEKEYDPIDEGDIWMPDNQEVSDEATEKYYKYEQYYGKDYEEYVKQEENEKNYTPIDKGDIWMPDNQEVSDEATEKYYKYEQYYGEDYEEYVKEEEN